MRKRLILSVMIIIIVCTQYNLSAETQTIRFSLQTRDKITNQPSTTTEDIDVSKIGIVIVDTWNYHWCMTATERVTAMAPRMNIAIEIARKMGLTIIWAPSDVVGMYSGYPQRERVLGMELVPVPKVRDMPSCTFTAPMDKCMCGHGINCQGNYGWDGICPSLILKNEDYMASSTDEVYSILNKVGIDHIIYMGLHTNMCLYGKPGALKFMWQAGMKCMLARDLNDAMTSYDPVTGFTPDKGTQITDEDLERAGIPTINLMDELTKKGMSKVNKIFETVRITPWGKENRPYFFEKSTIITLTTPLLSNVEIRYTLDGTEPINTSPIYTNPLEISVTTSLSASAFRKGKLVTIPTDSYFAKLPAIPPLPDVYLDDTEYIKDPYALVDETLAACFWYPKRSESYEGKPLSVRRKVYTRGLGCLAPSSIRFKLRPEFIKFVALVGIDDNILKNEYGRNIAMYSSVVFRLFIDGIMIAESPVMRISQEPWRFDVKIPHGSNYINLVCMDAGSRSSFDLANWINAGFCIK